MKPVVRTCSMLLAATTALLSSCSSVHRYQQYPAVTYLTSRGSPPAWTVAWSPVDSTKILVYASSYEGQAEVRLFDLRTKKSQPLVQVQFGAVSEAAWSPDGNRMAISVVGSTKRGNGPGLWILDSRDGSMHAISQEPPQNVVWLPDGRTLVVLATQHDPRRLMISLVDTETGVQRVLYSDSRDLVWRGVSLSPDEKQLVFSMQASGSNTSNLYLFDLMEGKPVQLTTAGENVSPAWSPRGDLIAYNQEVNQSGQTEYRLHLIAPSQGCDVEIGQFPDALSPSWSPDGRQLAFVGADGIYAVDFSELLGRDIYSRLCQ